MATVTITCSDGFGPFAEGASIKLEAAVETGSAKSWIWKRDTTVLGVTTSSTDVTVATDTEGMYVATATLDNGSTVDSPPFEVRMKARDGSGNLGGGDGGGETEKLPWFATRFAVWVAIIAALVALLVLFVLGLFGAQLGLSDTEWNTLDARAKVATRIVVPIVVLGSIAVVVGMWMALVEWRGRFEKPAPPPIGGVERGAGEDAAKVIDSVGKLRGAALVMVVGALLMFAAAWITQSTAKPPTMPTPTTTTTPAPDGT